MTPDEQPQPVASELLPCPFCGSSEGLDYFEGSTFRWRNAECLGCGASPGEIRHNTMADNQLEAENESRINLHKAWNTRAHPPTSAASLDAARVTAADIQHLKTIAQTIEDGGWHIAALHLTAIREKLEIALNPPAESSAKETAPPK